MTSILRVQMDKESKAELFKTLGWSGITCCTGLFAFASAGVGDSILAVGILFIIIYVVFRVFKILNINNELNKIK
jgi:divalent metal cation (Fe/Co/Zn/Cd) transporter